MTFTERARSINLNLKYWIKFYVGECPVCGRDASYRERHYSQKPEDPDKRYVHIPDQEAYDYCDI